MTDPEPAKTEAPAAEPADDGAAPAKADESPEQPAALPSVMRSFSLGWQMAQLYRKPTRITAPAETAASDGLPGLSGLVGGRRAEISVLEIEAALHSLAEQFKAAEIEVPSTEALREAMTAPKAGQSNDGIKVKVRELHTTILGRLTAVDFRLGKAYGLGRALAETCFVEAFADLEGKFNEYRVGQMQEWLADLSSALPAHGGRATSLSIEQWMEWAHAQDEASWATGASEAKRALTRQSKLWRALLSGEKQGTDMLGITDYTDAADRLVTQAKKVIEALLARYKYFLSPLAAVVLVVILVAAFNPSASSAVVAIGTAAAALGVSWKGIGSMLAGLGKQLQKPLWNAELDQAIAEAITVLPGEKAKIDVFALPPIGPARTAVAGD
jgi:hypothetical protein